MEIPYPDTKKRKEFNHTKRIFSMEKVAVLAITKNGIKMGLSLKKSFPD